MKIKVELSEQEMMQLTQRYAEDGDSAFVYDEQGRYAGIVDLRDNVFRTVQSGWNSILIEVNLDDGLHLTLNKKHSEAKQEQCFYANDSSEPHTLPVVKHCPECKRPFCQKCVDDLFLDVVNTSFGPVTLKDPICADCHYRKHGN